MHVQQSIDAAVAYLAKQVIRGICYGDFGLRHGKSDAWTTAIVGSTLAEFNYQKTHEMVAALLRLQHKVGGWGYNNNVPPDADTTLRVMEFFLKTGSVASSVIDRAAQFVLLHQKKNGGIATYLPEAVRKMHYEYYGWTVSHPCVSALAFRVLPPGRRNNSLFRYIADLEKGRDFRSYWWATNRVAAHLLSEVSTDPVADDSLDIALELLCKCNYNSYDYELCGRLMGMQSPDGSFTRTSLFRIPRPYQYLEDLDGSEEAPDDRYCILSTCAAVIALYRQSLLIQKNH